MQIFRNKYNQKTFGLVMIIVVSIFAFLLMDHFNYHFSIFDGTKQYYETDWLFGEQQGTKRKVTLQEKQWFEPGKTYELSTKLTYTGKGDSYPSAFFTIGNYEAKVFLDEELMFEFVKDAEKNTRIKSMGGAAFSIPLGKECEGKELKVLLRTPMDDAEMRSLPGVQMGDYPTNVRDLFLNCIPGILISAAITFVVIVLVLLGSPVDGSRWAYLHFSIFALLIVAYRAMQNLYVLYLWGSPYSAIVVEFFTIVSVPIPILSAYRYELKPYCGKAFNWLIGLSIANLLIQAILHFSGICDVVQMMEITHLWILICACSLVRIFIKVRKENSAYHPMRKLIPILVGSGMDLVIFYVKYHVIGAGSFFTVGNFVGLGLLISLVMMVWEARKEREKAFSEKERSLLLEKMAYMDSLTGISNRAAFDRELAQIEMGINKKQPVRIVAADLNGLKMINDNQGHEVGDDMIRKAAYLLTDCMLGYGNVFRTGGDEFFAILYGVGQAQWQNILKSLTEKIKKSNEGQNVPLSIAIGSAQVENSVRESIRTADKLMYKNKQEVKHTENYGFSMD